MRINISQGDLMTAISGVIRAVPCRPSHPVLAGVLFVADEERQQVRLTGFNLSLGIRISMDAKVLREGAFAFPATLLQNIVSKIPNCDLEIKVSKEVATICCRCGNYEIRGLDFSEFPRLPDLEEDDCYKIAVPQDLIIEGFKNTIFAASPDEAKQVLAGVNLKILEDGLEFAATDGHKLSVSKISNTNAEHGDSELIRSTDEREITLSLSVAQEVLRQIKQMLKAQKPSPVTFGFNDQTCFFQLGGTLICGRVLSGQYPDYHKLIPPEFARNFVVKRVELLDAIDRIRLFSDKKSAIIKVFASPKEIVVSADSKETGSAKEFIEVSSFEGEPIEFGFNAQYLAEVLKTANSEKIEIQANHSLTPVILRPVSSGDVLFLVMPIQLRHLQAVA